MQTKEIILLPEEAFNEELFYLALYKKAGLTQGGDQYIKPVKRSIDARARQVIVRVLCEVLPVDQKDNVNRYSKPEQNVTDSRQVIIVGSGPAGLICCIAIDRAWHQAYCTRKR
jgi:uncharacterized FAD-dependent dehydrogenase